MTKLGKLCLVVFCWTNALVTVDVARATPVEITFADFLIPKIFDFESMSTGNITGTESALVDFGLTSVSVSGASQFLDNFAVRANSSRALWANAGGLAVVDPGEVALANLHTYTIVFGEPQRLFGFGTHDQNDPALGDYVRVTLFSGATDLGQIDLGTGIGTADLNMFYLANDQAFDRVEIENLNISGFAIDNLTIETPEAGSFWLVSLGLLGVGLLSQRRQRRRTTH